MVKVKKDLTGMRYYIQLHIENIQDILIILKMQLKPDFKQKKNITENLLHKEICLNNMALFK